MVRWTSKSVARRPKTGHVQLLYVRTLRSLTFASVVPIPRAARERMQGTS